MTDNEINTHQINAARLANPCPGCKGERVQTRTDGIKIVCPICAGRGSWSPYPMLGVPYDATEEQCEKLKQRFEEACWRQMTDKVWTEPPCADTHPCIPSPEECIRCGKVWSLK